jgi:hypothetical protein
MKNYQSRLSSAIYGSRPHAANDACIGVVQITPSGPLRDQLAATMSLAWSASSTEAHAFAAALYDCICDESYFRRKRRLLSAFGAIAYDLLSAASIGQHVPCFRPMSLASFKGCRVGYRAAKSAIDLLKSSGLVRTAGGNIDLKSGTAGTVTRIFAAPHFLQALADYGIEPTNRGLHFVKNGAASQAVAQPILLNTGSRWQGNKRVKGKPLPVDYSDPLVMKFAEQVNRINAFTAEQSIEGVDLNGFHRIFNKGDDPTAHFNKGGRLWAIGGGHQIMPSRLKPGRRIDQLRSSIRINGEKTVEIDIGSSHLTIFLAKQGIQFDPKSDLYKIDGYGREIIKAYINLTLSLPRIPSKWPKSMMDDFEEASGYAITRDHSIYKVRDACFNLYPVLNDRASIDMDWSDLQFIESEAIIEAVDTLNQKYGAAALPVHDSIIVQENHKRLAVEVLEDSFENHVGVRPMIKIK